MDQNHLVGTAFGVIAGIYKATQAAIFSLLSKGITTWAVILSWISWQEALDAAQLALIGGAIGWIGSEVMSWLKKLYKKVRKK